MAHGRNRTIYTIRHKVHLTTPSLLLSDATNIHGLDVRDLQLSRAQDLAGSQDLAILSDVCNRGSLQVIGTTIGSLGFAVGELDSAKIVKRRETAALAVVLDDPLGSLACESGATAWCACALLNL